MSAETLEVTITCCPYCGADLPPEAAIVVCRACRTPYHSECWALNGGGCAALGCSSRDFEDIQGLVALPVHSPPTLRIRPVDIQRAARASRRPVLPASLAAAKVWQHLHLSVVVAGILGLLMGVLAQGLAVLLALVLVLSGAQPPLSLPWPPPGMWMLLWLAGGSIYGLLRHLFVVDLIDGLYRLARTVLLLCYTCALTYQLGHLIFIPVAYVAGSWAGLVPFAWLFPIAAGLVAIVVGLGVLYTFSSHFSLFRLAAGILTNTARLVGYAWLVGLLTGLAIALGALLLEALMELLLPGVAFDGWWGATLLIGATVGFIGALSAQLLSACRGM